MHGAVRGPFFEESRMDPVTQGTQGAGAANAGGQAGGGNSGQVTPEQQMMFRLFSTTVNKVMEAARENANNN